MTLKEGSPRKKVCIICACPYLFLMLLFFEDELTQSVTSAEEEHVQAVMKDMLAKELASMLSSDRPSKLLGKLFVYASH